MYVIGDKKLLKPSRDLVLNNNDEPFYTNHLYSEKNNATIRVTKKER